MELFMIYFNGYSDKIDAKTLKFRPPKTNWEYLGRSKSY